MKLILSLALVGISFISRAQPQPFQQTKYYSFHSNFWVNMHHFLYQQAAGDQARHLDTEGLELIDLNENEVWASMDKEETQVLKIAIQYYKENFIKKSLLFDLVYVRIWLQQQTEIITDTSYSSRFTDLLNNASKVYKKHFWPLHDQHNRTILEIHLSTIASIEEGVIGKISTLAGSKWPLEKVRIDLTAYANWAGAYAQTRPDINIIISTLDPLSKSSPFIEMVFHESSHILFLPDSDFLKTIAAKSKEMNVQAPRNLWHASLFYLCALTVQSELSKKGIDHEPVMDTKQIFSRLNTSGFRSALSSYYNNTITLEETITLLLKSY